MLRLAVISCVLALVLPAVAQAACGGVERQMPTKRKFGTQKRSPLIVGDSVLLGAIPEVAREGFEINAHGCRQWGEGLRVLWSRRHAGTLPRVVVMQLGTNASISVADVRRALDITGRRRLLVLMTPREVGGFGGPDARAIRRAGRLFRGRVLVLDWAKDTRRKHHWFAPDGIHLSYAGVRGLARYLRKARPYLKAPRQDRAAPA